MHFFLRLSVHTSTVWLPAANWAAGATINKDKPQHSVRPIVFLWLAICPIRANANAANAAVSSLGAQTVEVHG